MINDAKPFEPTHHTTVTSLSAASLAPDDSVFAPAAAQLKLPTAFRIAAIEADNYRTKTFILDGELEATPGQFVMAWLPRFDEKPFSLVNAAPITLMITAVGPFTRLVHSLAMGDRLWLRGPFGQGFRPVAAARQVALVAGGYGVAPLYWLAQSLLVQSLPAGTARRRPAVRAILGARQSRDLLYADRFARLLHTDGHVSPTRDDISSHGLLLTTDDGSRGLSGRVTDALEPPAAEGKVDAVYACGPDAMLAAVGALCDQYGVPAQLSWEAYMRCGVGLCGSCEHGGRLLCMDGPVLPR